MTDSGARALAAAILTRAANDYFLYQEAKHGKRSANLPSYVNIQNIGEFFRSEWCGTLMEGIGGLGTVRQSDLLPKLARLYLTGQYRKLPNIQEV